MSEPSDHLYVMQDELGRYKIGRSRDPEQRRRTLQYEVGMKMKLVCVLAGMGYQEPAIHKHLAEFRLEFGEWFQNSYQVAIRFGKYFGADANLLLAKVKLPELIVRPGRPDLPPPGPYRTVRKKLSDGTVKEYQYPRRRDRPIVPFVSSPAGEGLTD